MRNVPPLFGAEPRNSFPTRIAILTTSYPETAADPSGHFVRTEAELLREAGHDVTVVAPGRRVERVGTVPIEEITGSDAFGWPGVLPRLRERPARVLSIARWAWLARRTLLRGNYERVIAHWLVPCGWPVAYRLGIPVEVVAHGSDVSLLRRLPPALLEPLLSSWLAEDLRFRFVSNELKQRLIELCTPAQASELEARSTVRAAALDVSCALPRAAARVHLGLGERFVVVVVGRLVAEKRVAVALRCTKIPPGARRVVIGDGPELPQLQEQFPDVDFLGRLSRTETLHWLSAANALIVASSEEGAPSVIREARLLGSEVWSSKVGDVPLWAEADQGIVLLDELSEQ